MKTRSNIFVAATLTILFVACSTKREEKSSSEAFMEERINSNGEEQSAADSMAYPSQAMSSSAAVVNKKDTTRKFIRTADIKFKVKNVLQSTYTIEDIVNHFDGFVTYTKLNSNIERKTLIQVSPDSSLETTYYTVTNAMIIRVPNTQLDTVLKSIAKQVDFMDSRLIKAEDVALEILSNKLTQNRVIKSKERLTNAIDNRGKKLNETTNAEESLLEKQEQADNAKIANLSLNDKINFSTVSLELYQKQSTKKELVANDKSVVVYKESLGSSLANSIKFGWELLMNIVLVITKMWSLIVIAGLLYFLFKNFGNKAKK